MTVDTSKEVKEQGWRARLHEIIFEADTFAGKLFDISLMCAIVLSIITVMLDSVDDIAAKHGTTLNVLEWVFTAFFTLEYIARIVVLRRPAKYIFSFFGIIDLLSVVPTYIGLFVPATQYSVALRTLRLLRVFRVLKLARYLGEARILAQALKASRAKITVFLVAVLSIAIIMGTLMYIIEAEKNGDEFTSIPRSIYWAIVTMTTVGFGDIKPITELGQFVASILMIMGYGVIAVPTGIVGAELSRTKVSTNTRACESCGGEGHDDDAEHCKYCGETL